MGYLLLFSIGLLFLAVGVLSHRMIMRMAKSYAPEASTESGREVRDRTSGFALFNAWLSAIVGAALILFTAYRFAGNTWL